MGDINCKTLQETPQLEAMASPNQVLNYDKQSEKGWLCMHRNSLDIVQPARPETFTLQSSKPTETASPMKRTRSLLQSEFRAPSSSKYNEIQAILQNKVKTKPPSEIDKSVQRLLDYGKQSKDKIEMQRRQRELLEAKVQLELQQHQVLTSPPRKKAEFLKSQQDFLSRRNASVEKIRVLAQGKAAEEYTYKPQINETSRKMVERHNKKPSGSSVADLTAHQNGHNASNEKPKKQLQLDGASQFSQKIMPQTSKQLLKLKKSFDVSGLVSVKNNKGLLANKLIKQFKAALASLNKAGDTKLDYLEFCEVLKRMGITSKEDESTTLSLVQERALLLEAFRIVSEEQYVKSNSALSFILALFGLDLGEYWGSYCEECLKPSDKSQSPTKSEANGNNQTPTRESLRTPEKSPDLPTTSAKDNPQPAFQSLFANFQIPGTPSKQFGVRTQQYLKFSPEEIQEINNKFKSFYNTKMVQSKGYSQILTPVRKIKDRADSAEERKSSSAKKRDNELSANKKNRLLKQAQQMKIIPLSAQLNTPQMLNLDKLVSQKTIELRREQKQRMIMDQCTFKPIVESIAPVTRDADHRFIYLYQMGKQKQRQRIEQPPIEQSMAECTFQPNILKTKNFKSMPRACPVHQGVSYDFESDQKVLPKESVPAERMLEINIDLGEKTKTILVNQGDDPRELAKKFLEENQLSEVLTERLAKIIEEGIHKAETIKPQ